MPALLAMAWLLTGAQSPHESLALGAGLAGGARTDTGGVELFLGGEERWAPHWSARLELRHVWDTVNDVSSETGVSAGVLFDWRLGAFRPYAGLGLGLADFTFAFRAAPGCGPFDEDCLDTTVGRAGVAPIGWLGFRLGSDHLAFDVSGAAEYFRIRGVDEAIFHLRLGVALGLDLLRR